MHPIAWATIVMVSYRTCAVPPYIGCSIDSPTLDGMKIGDMYFFPSNSNSVPSKKERLSMERIDIGRTSATSSGLAEIVVFWGNSARKG